MPFICFCFFKQERVPNGKKNKVWGVIEEKRNIVFIMTCCY